MNKPKFTAEIIQLIEDIYNQVVKIDDYSVRVDGLYTLRIALVEKPGWCVVREDNNNMLILDSVMTNIINDEINIL